MPWKTIWSKTVWKPVIYAVSKFLITLKAGLSCADEFTDEFTEPDPSELTISVFQASPIRVISRVTKQLKTKNLRILGNFKEIPESWSPERQILTVVQHNCEKSGVKHSIEKPTLLNFTD